MGRFVVVGAPEAIAGFGLAGAELVAASDAESVEDALASIEGDALVVLTPSSAALARRLPAHPGQFVVVMPT